jgi:outer membrane immunogenic protein
MAFELFGIAMHRLVIRAFATAAILASTATLGAHGASAADLTKPIYKAPAAAPVYNWSGFYAGFNIGWGWNDDDVSLEDSSGFGPAAIAAGQVPASVNLKQDGALGGAQIGYNWQTGALVLGVEADFQGSDIHGSGRSSYPGPGFPTLTTMNSRLDWFGTVRGRVGYTPMPEALLYVTGGLAYGRVSSNMDFVITPTVSFHGSLSDVRTGWAVGAGAEWAFAPRWSVKAEYLYMDLGSTTVHMTLPLLPTAFLDYKLEHRDQIVRLGVNYKLGN